LGEWSLAEIAETTADRETRDRRPAIRWIRRRYGWGPGGGSHSGSGGLQKPGLRKVESAGI